MTARRTKDANAVLLAVYLWMFIILRVVWSFSDQYSTLILAGLAAIMCVGSVVLTRSWVNSASVAAAAMLAVVLVTLLLDILFRDNGVLGERLYEFVIYAAIPVLLFAQVRDLSVFFKTYSALALVAFALYCADPFIRYRFSQDYMVFGFQAMLPAFYGLYVAAKRTGHKIYMVLAAIALALVVIFGNRMAGIAGLVFLLAYQIGFSRISRARLVLSSAGALVAGVLLANIDRLISGLAALVRDSGYSSYALNAATLYLSGSTSSLSARRETLWATALDLVSQNPMFGRGLGYFESTYGTYVHNVVLDLLVSYGIVGLALYLSALALAVVEIFKSEGDLRLLGVLLLCMCFPKLLTSVHLFVEPAFWMLLFFGVFAPIYRRREAMRVDEVVSVHALAG